MEARVKKIELKKSHKVLLAIMLFIAAIAVCFGAYVRDCYHADVEAVDIVRGISDTYMVEEREDYYIFTSDYESNAGLIFYPGGKVESEAYAPLLARLAGKGITCILLKMPFNLAILDMDAAQGVKSAAPEIKNWYIAGHSLGGMTAAKYLKRSGEDYEGIIFLASYTIDNLSGMGIRALIIYGSNDKVMNMGRFEESQKNLPKDTTQVIITGGCHSYFGSYGVQKGDGAPDITREEQYEATVNAITDFVFPQ